METHFERLSALDRSFLAWETPTAPMHVACTLVFDTGPLGTLDGGLDIETLRKTVGPALVHVPRYRQKLTWVPGIGVAGWVDDDRFRLEHHLRHISLARPGSERQLRELAGWIVQQPLDRTRPLWEMWIVEGIEDGRFAVVIKIHHCMVDGIAGMELMQRLLSPDPDPVFRDVALPPARPAPGAFAVVAHELRRRATLPGVALRGLSSDTRKLASQVGGFARSIARVARPASRTAWNAPLGPHRCLDWFATDLAAMRAASRRLGGTINDLVLTAGAGAVRASLVRQGRDPRRMQFRVLAPVSVRRPDERGLLGNRVSPWVVDLPVGERRATSRLARIREQTGGLKQSQSALGANLLVDVADWTSSKLLSVGARAAMRLRAFNMIVTNVPGPQIPLYLAGARLLDAHPVAPLFDGIGINVALVSYDGRLFWGLNADAARVVDLADFRSDLERALDEIVNAPATRSRAARDRKRSIAGESR